MAAPTVCFSVGAGSQPARMGFWTTHRAATRAAPTVRFSVGSGSRELCAPERCGFCTPERFFQEGSEWKNPPEWVYVLHNRRPQGPPLPLFCCGAGSKPARMGLCTTQQAATRATPTVCFSVGAGSKPAQMDLWTMHRAATRAAPTVCFSVGAGFEPARMGLYTTQQAATRAAPTVVLL